MALKFESISSTNSSMCLLNQSLSAKADKRFDKSHLSQWRDFIDVQTAGEKLNKSSHMHSHVWRFLHYCINHVRELFISEHFFDIPTGSFKYPRDDFLQGRCCSGNLLSERESIDDKNFKCSVPMCHLERRHQLKAAGWKEKARMSYRKNYFSENANTSVKARRISDSCNSERFSWTSTSSSTSEPNPTDMQRIQCWSGKRLNADTSVKARRISDSCNSERCWTSTHR